MTHLEPAGQGEETALSAEQRNGGFEKTLANGIAIRERESRILQLEQESWL
jgi:hypothetical protein